MNTIEIYYNGAWVNIADYVTTEPNFPSSNRNRDYSLRVESCQMDVAITVAEVTEEGYEIPANTRIKATSSSKIVFLGYVKVSHFNYGSNTFSISIESDLARLTAEVVSHTTLNPLINAVGVAWNEYTAYGSCYYGFPVVGLTWLLNRMFYAVYGIELDTTEIDDVPLIAVASTPQGDFTPDQFVYGRFKYMFLRGDLLFAINQAEAINYATIDATVDYKYNKPTYFEVISEICSYFGLVISIVDVDSYKINVSEESYNTSNIPVSKTVNNDVKFDYSKDRIFNEIEGTGGAQFSTSYKKTKFYLTINSSERAITPESDGDGRDFLFKNNLEVLISDAYSKTNHYADNFAFCRLAISGSNNKTVSQSIAVCKGKTGDTPNTYNATMTLWNICRYKFRSRAVAYSKEVILTNKDEDTFALANNKIDLVWDNSEIIQEAYSE